MNQKGSIASQEQIAYLDNIIGCSVFHGTTFKRIFGIIEIIIIIIIGFENDTKARINYLDSSTPLSRIYYIESPRLDAEATIRIQTKQQSVTIAEIVASQRAPPFYTNERDTRLSLDIKTIQ